MANSRAHLSFVLLFAFLISSRVLTHELPEGHKHTYNDERNKSKLPTLSQDLEKDRRQGSIDVEERTPVYNAEVHELEGSTSGSVDHHPSEWTQRPIHPVNPSHLPLPPAKRDHYTHSIGYYAEPPPPAAAKSDHYTHLVGYFPEPPPEAKSDRDHYTHSIGYLVEPPPPAAAKSDHYTHSVGYLAEPPPPAAAKSDHYIHSIGYSADPPPPYTHSVGYLVEPPPPAAAKSDHYIHSIGYYADTPPPAAAKSDHYTHSVGYQPSGWEVIEPENYEDGSVMRHRKMMRPSEIDRRSFHAFPTKTSSITHGGKTSDGVPKMEDVDEETTN